VARLLFLGLASLALVASSATSAGELAAQTGLASWYGVWHHGKIMADGCKFNRHAMTAASRFFPLGAWVEVKNLRNGRHVLVQVRDRGPYVDGRIIDLSEAAAEALDFRRDGLAHVSVRQIWVSLQKTCV
jgi:rare lipoprotein A